MKAHRQPCPCGCKRFVVPPLIYCQCGTLSEQEADELVRRWNAFEGVTTHTTMLDALQAARRLFDEALPQFDWGQSALDANAIRLLNEVTATVARAIRAAS